MKKNSIFEKQLKIKHVFYVMFFISLIIITIILDRAQFKMGDIIIAFSTLISPLVALQIQAYIDKIKTTEAKKLDVFKTLMTTRATPLSYKHVEAINMIDLEFYNDLEVKCSLRKYISFRNNLPSSNMSLKDINDFLSGSLIDLLQKIAYSLGYNFSDEEIRNGIYRPQGHIDYENFQGKVLTNIAAATHEGKIHVVIDKGGKLKTDHLPLNPDINPN